MNIFNDEFKEFIRYFNAFEVEYVLVGGYSVIIHGYSRTTGDLDLLVNCTRENYARICQAFAAFQLPVFDMSDENFLNIKEFDVFTFGRPPVCIDLLTQIKGSTFEEVYQNSKEYQIDPTLTIRVVHLNMLLHLKKSSGRYKDLDDISQLEKIE